MSVLAYFYLLRVPLITGLVLVLFPLLSVLGSPLTPLLENIFNLSGWGTFWTALTAVLTAWSIMLTGTLVLVNAPARMGLPSLFQVARLRAWMSVVAASAALPTIAAQFLKTGDFGYSAGDVWLRIGATLGGGVAAYAVGYLALLVAVRLAPAHTQADSVRAFPAPRFLKVPLENADATDGRVAATVARAGLKLRAQPKGVWKGFVDPTGQPWSGHWLAFSFGTATLILFEGVDLAKRIDLMFPLPATMFVLSLFLCANWMLGLAAFFLDRFRIPLLVPFALLCGLASLSSNSDHYFPLVDRATPPRILASDVLKAHAGRKPIIVVATAGGGIQAAVWTARVLTGLQEDSLGSVKNTGSVKWPADFASSLALVSSVSGGATGAMYFLNRYQDGPPPGFQASEDLESIVQQAAHPSLDDVAWALVDHDIPRLYFPYSVFSDVHRIDRGTMLDRDWRNDGNIRANLAQWRTGVGAWRPATIFNSTIVESGRPLLLGTTDLAPLNPARAPTSFYDWQPGHDVPVVTAVRLAATFPYVSPAARPENGKPAADHAVDGGYYDNYGVSTLVEWLEEGLVQWNRQAGNGPAPPVLAILIRSFPDDADPAPTPKSALFQLSAPFQGLLNVREAGQVIRDSGSLKTLQNLWPHTGDLSDLQVATLQFKGPDAPLSWAINQQQRNSVEAQWQQILCGKDPKHACEPEDDLRLVRCVVQESYEGDCAKLRKKEPW